MRSICLVTAVIIVFQPALVVAQPLSGAETLQEAVGARPAGMGEAFSSLGGDLHALYYNIAGLADIKTAAVSSMYAANMFQDTNAQLAFCLPVHWFGQGTLAAGVLHMRGAEMDINYLDGTHETVVSQTEWVGTLGYARPLTSFISGGCSLKVYSSTLVEEYSALAVACDFGLQYRVQDLPGVNAGLAVQNLGGEIKYLSRGDALPTTLRLGLAYHHALAEAYDITMSTDLLFPNDGDPAQHLGAECSWKKTLFVRAGYKAGYDLQTFTLGAGVHVNGLELDYAYTGVAIGDPVHRFSLGYVFTAPAGHSAARE
ncbi:PorV/PorQ family protein [candidate division FCPU426 bacterium]|nr:PorV/PorQ family protein [candidate division FCPU426 bacterium]